MTAAQVHEIFKKEGFLPETDGKTAVFYIWVNKKVFVAAADCSELPEDEGDEWFENYMDLNNKEYHKACEKLAKMISDKN